MLNDSILNCLFEPLIMSNLTLKNKLFMAPMGTGFDIDKTIPFLAARARGGVSMITTGETCVHPSGRVGFKNEAVLENEKEIPADAVVLASGMKSARLLADQLSGTGIEYHIAGSALKPGKIDDAIRDGYEIGNNI
jgi:2,4-dienoyl-CoA reductase-like NADH-dependent reductase (Old Yellow Enzyme family)